MQSLGLAEMANQQALNYARDRLQMRAASGPVRPDKPADPIIVHPDVRRMLLTNRAYTEAGRAFRTWVALLIDQELSHPDPAARDTSVERKGVVLGNSVHLMDDLDGLRTSKKK